MDHFNDLNPGAIYSRVHGLVYDHNCDRDNGYVLNDFQTLI